MKIRLIDRFGVKAILGRDTLYTGEAVRMLKAEQVYNAKLANMDADNWA